MTEDNATQLTEDQKKKTFEWLRYMGDRFSPLDSNGRERARLALRALEETSRVGANNRALAETLADDNQTLKSSVANCNHQFSRIATALGLAKEAPIETIVETAKAKSTEALADRVITGADVIDWADGIRGALGTEHASKVSPQQARIADAIASAMHAPARHSDDAARTRRIAHAVERLADSVILNGHSLKDLAPKGSFAAAGIDNAINEATKVSVDLGEERCQRGEGRLKSLPIPGHGIAEEIREERDRQTSREGWTPEHDDLHDRGELAMAAACYAAREPIFIHRYAECPTGNTGDRGDRAIRPAGYSDPWPFPDFDKRHKHDRRRQLVIAGALIQAEIERLDRVEARETNNVQ